MWTLNLDYYTGGAYCTETITLSGNAESGTVTGINYCGWMPNETGTYTKTADFSAAIHSEFPSSWGEYVKLDWVINSSEAEPNTVTGTGSSQQDTQYFPCNITGTKVSNLQ
jgi:hypothetical protein